MKFEAKTLIACVIGMTLCVAATALHGGEVATATATATAVAQGGGSLGSAPAVAYAPAWGTIQLRPRPGQIRRAHRVAGRRAAAEAVLGAGSAGNVVAVPATVTVPVLLRRVHYVGYGSAGVSAVGYGSAGR